MEVCVVDIDGKVIATSSPEMDDFAAEYNKMAYRNLDREMLDHLNTLWENVKIN